MVIRTEVAMREHPGIVLGELACDGLCVSDVDGSIVEIEEVRWDPCRCFRDAGEFVDLEGEEGDVSPENLDDQELTEAYTRGLIDRSQFLDEVHARNVSEAELLEKFA